VAAGLEAAVDRTNDDPRIRVCVLTGEGVHRRLAGVGVGGAVNSFEGRRDDLAILPSGKSNECRIR